MYKPIDPELIELAVMQLIAERPGHREFMQRLQRRWLNGAPDSAQLHAREQEWKNWQIAYKDVAERPNG